MTKLDSLHGAVDSRSLDDAVASLTGPVARRLIARYTPVYAVVAVLLLVAAVAPSRVAGDTRAASDDLVGLNELAGSGGDAAFGTDLDGEVSTPYSSTTSRTIPVQTEVSVPVLAKPPTAPMSDAPSRPDGGADNGFREGGPGGFVDDADGGQGGGGDEGFSGGESPCPVEFGEDPEVSRGVAGVLLSAASPVLSLLGPFGPNAVPALGVASPILPIVAPVADKFAPYIRLMNPLFLQVSQLGTTLWQGPLQPLEGPLLQLNDEFVQPIEVELLGVLAGPIEQVNATPLTPCLQRLVYNLVAPVPVPTP